MTATYSTALTTTRDHIRLALGDTDTDAPLLQDETIDAKLSAFGYAEALAQLAESLAVLHARKPTKASASKPGSSSRRTRGPGRSLTRAGRRQY